MSTPHPSGRTMPALTPERRFIVAAARSEGAVIRRALAAGLSPDAAPPGKPSALCYAALGDELDLLALLIDHGADVNFADGLGNTPCIYAALGGSVDCLQALARCGADLCTANRRGDRAVDCCRTACCRHVIEQALAVDTATEAELPAITPGARGTPLQ